MSVGTPTSPHARPHGLGAKSTSEPLLQPLWAPVSLLTPLEWSQREPKEFSSQRERAAKRYARKLLGCMYRNVLQNKFGLVLYKTVAPWPEYLPLPDKGPDPILPFRRQLALR
mmetsp:Transcript_24759/g.69053  ORF Transcript_24759/g.69053 Transcript_24759/m.69053 type:complete len:113 (+) Transcript_24759:64-402(+)